MRAATHAQHDAGGEWDQGARQEEEPDMALAVAAPSLPLLPAAAAAAAGPAPLLGSRPGDASLQLQHQQQQQLTAGASTSARLTPTAQAAGPTPAAARPPPAPAPLLRTAWSASLLGFLPPSLESSYQRYAAGQASMLAWVWAPLMSAILLAAVARCVRSGDLSELPVSVLFAWPYPLVSAGLLLAPRCGRAGKVQARARDVRLCACAVCTCMQQVWRASAALPHGQAACWRQAVKAVD